METPQKKVLITAFLSRTRQPELEEIAEDRLVNAAKHGWEPVANLTREQLLELMQAQYSEFERVRASMRAIHEEATNWVRCDPS